MNVDISIQFHDVHGVRSYSRVIGISPWYNGDVISVSLEVSFFSASVFNICHLLLPYFSVSSGPNFVIFG